MVYMGSKNRIAKELIPIITKDLKPNQWYCEPFVGGANMIDKIEHPYKLGADNNKYLIALLEADSIIYCAPPYNGTTKYKDNFDSDAFWQWCRDKAKEGHTVYVSEYNAPEDFKCIWEKQINSNLGGTSKTATEKLFTI